MSAPPTNRSLARRLRACGLLLPAGALLLTCWILNVSRLGSRAEGCPEGCATETPGRDNELRLMSLNMLHGFPRFTQLGERLALIASEIERLDADIVCLQEVPWVPPMGGAAGYLAQRTGMNHVYVRANGNRRAILFEEGEAILSRYPLREVTFTELRPQAGFFEHRMALKAAVESPWGDVTVFVTHLTNGDPEVNRAQAESLMTFVDSDAHHLAIIAGDFNATEDSAQIQSISQRAEDAWRLVHGPEEGFTCCVDDLTSARTARLQKRIDYVFLVAAPKQDVRVSDAQVILNHPFETSAGRVWASDHAGLLVTLSTLGGLD